LFGDGSLQGDVYPATDQQEWQEFLAWRQQGSLTAPQHSQLQTAISGPHPHPQITGCPVRHTEISTDSPPQSYPNAQIMNSLSPPSDNQATNRPSNVQGSTSVSPGHCHSHASSHSQSISSAQVLSQQSEVLSDDSNERMFPGAGALMNLEARFRPQTTKLHAVDHAGSHAHLKSHSVPQLPAHVGAALQVQLGVSQRGAFQHVALPEASPPPAPSAAPPPPPPADDVTAKPQQPEPSPLYGRPSSASSFDSDSSDSMGCDEKEQIGLRPGLVAACHADVLSTSSRTPPGSTTSNTGIPTSSVDPPESLFSQANNLTGGPGLNPSTAANSDLFFFFSNSDQVADLVPLYHQMNTFAPPKKKKKTLLSFFRQKRTKDGQTS